MPTPLAPADSSPALRLARRAWTQLQSDSRRSVDEAEQALALASDVDPAGRAWALLVLGFNRLNLATPAAAIETLQQAGNAFAAIGRRDGQILAETGIARAWWRQGRLQQAYQRLQVLRDEGLQSLRGEQRGLLLNALAGCLSSLGDSEQAFAHMYAALRDTPATHAPGFDVALHCNLGHELIQLGDLDAALAQIDEGLERCRRLTNPRLLAALLINRAIALMELGRAPEALPVIDEICTIPDDEQGRGRNAACFEILALVALRAGEAPRGRALIAAAEAAHHEGIADEAHELAQARCLLALADGDAAAARAWLAPCREQLLQPLADDPLSPRIRHSGLQLLAELAERDGRLDDALLLLKADARVQAGRAAAASRARYQAAALQTELARMQRRLRDHEARSRETERVAAELSAINRQLQRKVREVEDLRDALREQATRDALTGLFNRRHFNDAAPPLLAQARRDGQALAAVIIDLDHFKAVNDRYGHDVGDRLLRAFGQVLGAEARASDLVCRWGGEEFCLLLPATPLDAACRLVERLLQRWRSSSLDMPGQRLERLSFSAGVCDSHTETGDIGALLRAADHALLLAKRNGRAQVLSAAEPSRL
ncbi:MAG: diguanylate cyclase [Proteobacteria bacterium]|nr:diguanylate cyclase [Pseudomonadota bacterium]